MLWSEVSQGGPQLSGSGDPEDSHRTPVNWPRSALAHCLPSPCPRASSSATGRCRRRGSCKGEVGLGWWGWGWVCGEGAEEPGEEPGQARPCRGAEGWGQGERTGPRAPPPSPLVLSPVTPGPAEPSLNPHGTHLRWRPVGPGSVWAGSGVLYTSHLSLLRQRAEVVAAGPPAPAGGS